MVQITQREKTAPQKKTTPGEFETFETDEKRARRIYLVNASSETKTLVKNHGTRTDRNETP